MTMKYEVTVGDIGRKEYHCQDKNWRLNLTQDILDDPTPAQQKYFDECFVYQTFEIDFGYSGTPSEVLDGRMLDIPYWCLEGAIDYGLTGKQDYNPDDCQCEYHAGYYWDYKYGDIKKIDNQNWKFITTVLLPEEQEHQNENGDCLCEHRGNSFLAIWEKV